jgi:hypothetical protein
VGEGFRINHLRDFTMRRVRSHDNGTQNHFIGSEGQILDMADRAQRLAQAVGHLLERDAQRLHRQLRQSRHNNGNAFRNDHVCRNLLLRTASSTHTVQASTLNRYRPLHDSQQRSDKHTTLAE